VSDVQVEFIGGPLDGTVGTVRAMTTGRPPGRFAIEVGSAGEDSHVRHDYQVGVRVANGNRWRYEYLGIRPR
jgi:hypothetical protein